MSLRSILLLLAFLTSSFSFSLLTSCASNEQFEQRMERRNETYSNYDERRNIRLGARQQRTDAWFDRVMH